MPCLANTSRIAGLFLIALLLLSGCDGGGGGDDGESEIPSHTLEGAIQASTGTATDGDVNDPSAPFAANDNPTLAQAIPNPVALGGYVNAPGAGPNGRSQLAGDVVDWYRVGLAANQTISLSIAEDGRQDDLDLFLTDPDGNVLDASLGQGKIESLTASQTGEFLVVVQVFQGASNYILTIGQQAATAEDGGLHLRDPFVPGDVVARLADSTSSDKRLNPYSQGLTAAAQAGAAGRNQLFSLEDLQGANVYKAQGLDASAQPAHGLRFADPELRRKWDTLRMVKAMRLRTEVVSADPNYIRYPSFVPNDALYPLQWHYPLIDLPQAWDISTGADTIAAVLDTGVALSHPDLQGQLVAGYDFIRDPANAGDGDGIDANPDDPGDGINPDGSSSFHGTHVTGTVAAATHNTQGVAGVAFSAKIMPLRVLGRFGATDFDIEQAVRFAAGLPNDSGTQPPQRADIINLSLGGPGFSTSAQAVFNAARDAGVVVVAAAGNQANNTPIYPAAYDGVIGVSAVDINKEPAPYSNFGSFVDVAAPGGNMSRDIDGDGHADGVLSTGASDAGGMADPGFSFLQGTSMAAPHLTGVIALMRSVNPGLTPQDMDNLLAGGAISQDLGTPGWDERFGHGLINAFQAVIAARDAAGAPVTPPPRLVVSPSALNFGLDRASMTIEIRNGGADPLTVNSPSHDADWLSLTAEVDSHGLGRYTATVDRSNLVDGLYVATLIFQSSANTFQVPVLMQVNRGLSSADVGQQYVLLIDPASSETKDTIVAERQTDGDYIYRFSAVAPGRYQIFAGSDINNDGFICDLGESCGAYLTLDQPITIEVNGDLDGLDFTSGFASSLSGFNAGPSNQGSGLSRQSGRRLGR